MRKREIRGYSRTSGIQLSRPSSMRNGGLAVLIIGFVIGICGLATTVTQQTDRLVAATASQNKSEAPSTIDTHANAPVATPATLLETIPVPTTAKPSITASLKSVSCNAGKRAYISSQKVQRLRTEAKRHRDAMWSLQTTGVVARFLNPSMYNKRVSQEIAAHKAVLKQIQQTYAAALVRAHC